MPRAPGRQSPRARVRGLECVQVAASSVSRPAGRDAHGPPRQALGLAHRV